MHRFVRRSAVTTALIATAVGGAWVGVSSASSQTRVLRACVRSGSHPVMHALPSGSSCPRGQHLLEWNTQGPPGPVGRTGQTGRTGAAGPGGIVSGTVPPGSHGAIAVGGGLTFAAFCNSNGTSAGVAILIYTAGGTVRGASDSSSKGHQSLNDKSSSGSVNGPFILDVSTTSGQSLAEDRVSFDLVGPSGPVSGSFRAEADTGGQKCTVSGFVVS